MTFKIFIAFVAPILTVASVMPQLVKTMKTKQTRDLSLMTFLLLGLSASLWTAYGFHLKDMAIILTNGSLLAFAVIIIGYKSRYG